jgi:hypothetical protein
MRELLSMGFILFYFMKKSGRSCTARSLRVAGLGEKRGNVLLRLGDVRDVISPSRISGLGSDL